MRVTNRTTYQHDFGKPPFSKLQPLHPTYLEFSTPPEDGNWLDEKTLERETFGNAEEKIKAMYKKRYVSCYQRDYCRPKKVRKDEVTVKTLLDYCKEIYSDRTAAVLPPLQTARRLYGYMNPALFKSHLTAYQVDYEIPESRYLSVLKRFPNLPDPSLVNEVHQGAPDSCSVMKKVWSPCQCHLELCIGWYPCGLKYCKGKDETKNSQPNSYRCGIKTCRKCHLFSYFVAQKQTCLWDE